jgi:hypothetical protein
MFANLYAAFAPVIQMDHGSQAVIAVWFIWYIAVVIAIVRPPAAPTQPSTSSPRRAAVNAERGA